MLLQLLSEKGGGGGGGGSNGCVLPDIEWDCLVLFPLGDYLIMVVLLQLFDPHGCEWGWATHQYLCTPSWNRAVVMRHWSWWNHCSASSSPPPLQREMASTGMYP